MSSDSEEKEAMSSKRSTWPSMIVSALFVLMIFFNTAVMGLSNHSHAMMYNMAGGGVEYMAHRVGSDYLKVLDKSIQSAEKVHVETRMLSYNGDMSMTTQQGTLSDIIVQIVSMIEQKEGYIESKNFKIVDSSRNLTSIDMKLRVPPQDFYNVIDSIPKLSPAIKVNAVSSQSEDVTDRFVDAATRASTIDASRKALQTLLQKANDVSEILSVQNELNRMTEEYESQKARANSLQKQANLSTLSVKIREVAEEHDETHHWTPLEPLRMAMKHVLFAVKILAHTLLYMSVWALFPLIGFVVYRSCRRELSRRGIKEDFFTYDT